MENHRIPSFAILAVTGLVAGCSRPPTNPTSMKTPVASTPTAPMVTASKARLEPAAAKLGAAPSAPPFSAVMVVGASYVRLRPDAASPAVGLVREGATVTVSGCEPDCATKHAWALLGSDGAIRLSSLRPKSDLNVGAPEPSAETLWYGWVGPRGVKIYQAPKLRSRLLTRLRVPRELAFRPDEPLRARGWLERVEKGFVRARSVRLLKPSEFSGEAQPRLPLAFVVRDLAPRRKANARANPSRRYDRLAVQRVEGSLVWTDRGALPRKAVRIIALRQPPPSIPPGASWVHIDLSEQTLTAYEGDRPVFATLISTGKTGIATETHVGLYQVEQKMIYSDMRGEPDDPYVVDRVPYVLYFNKDEAVHGAYWHDRFGHRASHGCVNLSLADSRWLFDWAPPKLPVNWSVIEPKAAGLTSLWVLVEDRGPG